MHSERYQRRRAARIIKKPISLVMCISAPALNAGRNEAHDMAAEGVRLLDIDGIWYFDVIYIKASRISVIVIIIN